MGGLFRFKALHKAMDRIETEAAVRKNILLAIIFMVLFTAFALFPFPSQAAGAEPELLNKLPKYPANGQTYWIAFKEGFRNNRIELSNCSISIGKGKAYIEWRLVFKRNKCFGEI